MLETTYTSLRANLASMMERVLNDREVVIVRRKHGQDVAMISADELSSLLETAHLLRSPRNAERLWEAMASVNQGRGKKTSLDKLRQDLRLGKPR